MTLRIGRTLPPTAAPLSTRDILCGLTGLCRGKSELDRFEMELNAYFGIGHSFLVSSGKTALTVILEALKNMFPGRDEVLIPAFTCYSVPSAIIRAGLRVRLCDLDPATFDFDYDQLSHILSQQKGRLLCVVPVHLFGFPADIDRIRRLIKDDTVIIVEDAAQAMGGEHCGRKLGTIGDVGFFSLGRGKAFTTVEGGIILTRREDIAEHINVSLEQVPNYSRSEIVGLFLYSLALLILLRPWIFWIPKALPFLRLGETIFDTSFKMRRLSAFQAGLAVNWEIRLLEFRKRRTELARGFTAALKRIGISTPWHANGTQPDLIRYPLIIRDIKIRQGILEQASRRGLGIMPSFPEAIHSVPELKEHFAGDIFPVAASLSRGLITIPLHPLVSRSDQTKIYDFFRFISINPSVFSTAGLPRNIPSGSK
jgi:perosamine synthetase